MKYIQINIPTLSKEIQEAIIAILSNLNYYGFEELDNEIIAFITAEDFEEIALNEVFHSLSIQSFQKKVIEEQNWNAFWESNFEPIQVENFVGVRAHFHQPFQNVTYEIIITPKMSFGTGHHATTYMMMQLMQQINFHQQTVADFGTGTGLLAILAEKLGAVKVLGTDNDDWCIENANENIAVNRCQHIEIKKVNNFNEQQQFNVVLANINRNIIVDNCNYLSQNVKYNGILLLSGLLQEDEDEIIALFKNNQFMHEQTLTKSGWIAIYFKKKIEISC
jgi:ribosomal protein L11 methyltransferase